jgi:rhamnogalacturonan endolyase
MALILPASIIFKNPECRNRPKHVLSSADQFSCAPRAAIYTKMVGRWLPQPIAGSDDVPEPRPFFLTPVWRCHYIGRIGSRADCVGSEFAKTAIQCGPLLNRAWPRTRETRGTVPHRAKAVSARSRQRALARHTQRRARQRAFEPLESRQLLALTHLYTFNNGTANDSVGTANGTLFNGATIVEGWLNLQNGATLTPKTSGDATAQYAQLPNGILPASGSATIETWYTTSSLVQNWARVFDFGDQSAGTGNSYLFFTPRSANGDARAVLHPAGGAERVATYAGGTNNGLAHMASVVIDSVAAQLRLYIDGTLASSTALTGAGIGNINEAAAFLGRSLFDTDSAFTGMIDEVRIYDEALSADTIAQHAASGATRAAPTTPARQIENLDRGLVGFRRSTSQVYLSWRLLATDPTNIVFNIYRSANGGAAVKLNSSPITQTTDFVDSTFTNTVSNVYTIRPIIDGVEQAAVDSFTIAANAPVNQFLSIPLVPPPGGHLPATGVTTEHDYTYTANDVSVGDLDGDGQYEIILKWDPTDSKDNSQDGYTGNVFIDAYKLDGTRLWRLDLGRNIRAGAHYTQFQVYDLDGDGKAEVAMKTAPGTIDGLGHAVLMGSDLVTADYRNSEGYILAGSEYLTVFNGLTGANMSTIAFQPARGSVTQWGDSYGNRVDRYTATVAYLDGQRPSLVMGRGYYGPQSSNGQSRNEIAAYDFRNGQLTLRWHFKAGYNINNNINSNYVGQGPHGIDVADVDGDGKDEIIYGAMALDDNGTGLYSTGLGHGDAFHVSDLDQNRAGQEVFMVHESPSAYGAYGGELRNARTGQELLAIDGHAADVGRGNAFDIDPRYPGFELWTSADPNIYNVSGTVVQTKPSNMFQNFGIQWDADPLYELLDGTTIGDWRISGGSGGRTNYIFAPSGLSSNNGTKSTPSLVADLFGDWRDEVIWRTGDSSALQIWSTTISATSRMYTPMQDIQYRESIAWQNSAYNQPPNPSYYMGDGMKSLPVPNLYFAGGPSNIAISGVSVPENQAAGAVVGNLSSTASGAASTYTYSFVTGSGSIDNGAFEIVNGQLRTTASFDYETKSSYSVRIRTTDANGLFYDKAFLISVVNVNEAPTVATPAGGNLNDAGLSAGLSVLGADDAGESNLSYSWSATGPGSVTYSANDSNAAKSTTATFSKAGAYAFTVTITDAGSLSTMSQAVVVVDPIFTSIDVSPASASLLTLNSKQFSANALDQFGDLLPTQPSFTWTLDAGSVGSISTTGQYTAPAGAGTATVRAASGSFADTATVTVSWIKGDADLDGHRNAADVSAFLRTLTNLTSYQVDNTLSGADMLTILDTNSDGVVTNGDIQALLGLLADPGSGSGSVVNEPAPPQPIPVQTANETADASKSSSTSPALPRAFVSAITTVSHPAAPFRASLADVLADQRSLLSARDQYFNDLDPREATSAPFVRKSGLLVTTSSGTGGDQSLRLGSANKIGPLPKPRL